MSSSVKEFFLELEPPLQDIGRFLDDLLQEEFGLQPKWRYRLPFYYKKSWICYLSPKGNKIMELAFTRGNELSNEDGLLLDLGRKQVKSLLITSIRELDSQALRKIINEAVLLDETVPYAVKRKKS